MTVEVRLELAIDAGFYCCFHFQIESPLNMHSVFHFRAMETEAN